MFMCSRRQQISLIAPAFESGTAAAATEGSRMKNRGTRNCIKKTRMHYLKAKPSCWGEQHLVMLAHMVKP